ncbi:ferritin family protein [uncultured Desulfosarcina sp.]|uniref:ferritin-like domain-containing protein n=1 Tax=uncultured Desulfosarcina sp. TaxID=218289 RepID=UPI0029C7F17D|nr:ferritin family protein [uncultured Desulfosarcina sp.]
MDFENLDAIISFAIEKEKEAAEFYEENSESEMMSGKRQMLKEFAAEERKHQKMLEAYLATGIAENIEGYRFEWISDIKRSDYVDAMEYKPGMAYNELLMLAMKREEAALKLYNQLLRKADNDDAKKLFKMLCQEEAKHKLALETLYDDYMAKMGD